MKQKKAIAVTHTEAPWRNVDFVKDCGLVPYLLHRNHGMDVTMAGAPGGPYPYHKMTTGLKLNFLSDGHTDTKVRYITDHAAETSLLILYGVTYDNLLTAEAYKMKNPDGLIYCGLDMNSDYADRIPFCEEPYSSFFSGIDLMGTSCEKMADFLSEKWPWQVECFRNGYYDFHKECGTEASLGRRVPFEDRKDVLLYAGRLRSEQKQSENLFKAFALASDRIPSWTLRIVGEMEDDIKRFLDGFFLTFPQVRERITFVDNITDRADLHREFETAKVFVTTSAYEGGVNNTIAEAMCAGMVFGVTAFDAHEEVTVSGLCGESVPVGDVFSFSEMLVRLCNRSDLKTMSDQSYERGGTLFDMTKIVEEIYGKLCDKGL